MPDPTLRRARSGASRRTRLMALLAALLGGCASRLELPAEAATPGAAVTAAGPAAAPVSAPTAAAAPFDPVSSGPRQLVARLQAQGMPARLLMTADIGECNLLDRQPRDSVHATAALLEDRPGLVLAAGDIAYPDGRAVDFAECFDPAWGSARARMLPAPGNHEWHARDAAPYFQYFGSAAGAPGRGWYSVDFAGWHLIALNSNLSVDEGSAQLAWLRADLRQRPPGCLLAFWHHPRFSSGGHGNNVALDAAWRVLAQAGADVVLNGHDHDYERFAPQDGEGHAASGGIRQFVVGTGGAMLSPFVKVKENSEVRNDASFGILELNLDREGYEWRFLGTDQAEFEDRGSASCHQAGR